MDGDQLMNDSTGAPPERRRHARIIPKGTAILQMETFSHRGRIANLSEGGIYIMSRVAAPERLLAHAIDLEIRLDDGHADWLASVGQVVRIEPEGIAIAFDAAPDTLLRMIDRLTTASHARRRLMSVILIDDNTQRRAAMATGFRATGCDVIEAATPLEAIVRLGESSFEPDVIAVADSEGTTAAAEMREFIVRDHPKAKLITIGDDLLEPDGFAHWLSSADPNADLAQRISELLFRAQRQKPPS
jgi:CheY-like chemotaxis protein